MVDFAKLAEQRIEQAMEAGAFDDLPGAGKPLPRQEVGGDAIERAGFKMMARAGALPTEIILKKEVAALWARWRGSKDEAAKQELMRQIADLEMRIAMALEQRQR